MSDGPDKPDEPATFYEGTAQRFCEDVLNADYTISEIDAQESVVREEIQELHEAIGQLTFAAKKDLSGDPQSDTHLLSEVLHEQAQTMSLDEIERQSDSEGEITAKRPAVAEEAADALITVHVLCELIGIDVAQAYQDKMQYNLTKSGRTDENGKVIDDGG